MGLGFSTAPRARWEAVPDADFAAQRAQLFLGWLVDPFEKVQFLSYNLNSYDPLNEAYAAPPI